MHQKNYQEKYIGGKIWRQTQESTLEIFIPGGYIKTAKTKKRPFFGQDRNFFVSKSQDLSRFPEKFPVFCVVTHTPGRMITQQPRFNLKKQKREMVKIISTISDYRCGWGWFNFKRFFIVNPHIKIDIQWTNKHSHCYNAQRA